MEELRLQDGALDDGGAIVALRALKEESERRLFEASREVALVVHVSGVAASSVRLASKVVDA